MDEWFFKSTIFINFELQDQGPSMEHPAKLFGAKK